MRPRNHKGRMNIVYVVLEDFRGLSMGALCDPERTGRPCARTPHLDALAADGVLFENAFAQSPICNPSRTSTMTGRYPGTTGVFANDDRPRDPDMLPNLPQLLQIHARGRIVTTSPYSKVFHLPAAVAPQPMQPWERQWWNRTSWQGVPASLRAKLNATPPRKMRGPGYGHVMPTQFHHMAFRRSVAMLGALLNQASSPFFYAMGISGTHTPLVPPMSYVRRYDATSVKLPASHAPHAPLLARKDGFQSFELSAGQQRAYIATYLAAASYVDDQVGAIVDLVNRRSRRPTALIVHADHGFHLGEHGRWSKYTMYEEAVHVPLLMRVPGGPRGVRRADLVELVDVLPTILSLWGVPPGQRPPLDGRDLLAHARGGTGATAAAVAAMRQHVISAMRHPIKLDGAWVCAEVHYVRTARLAFTSYLHNGRVVNSTMFDLTVDPLEQSNLIVPDKPALPYMREWDELVDVERETWPRHEVNERDEASKRAGERCGEYRRRRRRRH